jgi:tRNA-2-methylthio-N6-dimethylallyladenosine synthase
MEFSDTEAETEQSKQAVFIKTYGCQMNEHDSRKLAKILEPGYRTVMSAREADLVLINTCSVRDKPEQKLYSLLGELQEIKRENPALMIGVGGCVAQQEGDEIVRRSRNVDFVFGTHNLSLVPSLIARRREVGVPQVAVNYRDEWEELPLGFPEDGRVSAFISISRGCNKNCTYCIVPTTRGPEVSRARDEIEREVRIAAHRGVKEIVLLGQTVNSYGLDLQPRSSFVELLNKLSEIPGIERIRFTSPHPQEIRSDFIDLVCSNPKICRHVHMPLQSGSDRILKLMNRNYRRDRYRKIIAAIKDRVPTMAITTDIIVGFPGETERDFLDTMDLLEEAGFVDSFSFMFSSRPGTAAADLPGQIEHAVMLERLMVLQAKQREITDRYLAAWVGKVGELLIDGPSSHEPTKLQGRLSQNTVVNLTKDYPECKPGSIVVAKITGAGKFTLRGELEQNLPL